MRSRGAPVARGGRGSRAEARESMKAPERTAGRQEQQAGGCHREGPRTREEASPLFPVGVQAQPSRAKSGSRKHISFSDPASGHSRPDPAKSPILDPSRVYRIESLADWEGTRRGREGARLCPTSPGACPSFTASRGRVTI